LVTWPLGRQQSSPLRVCTQSRPQQSLALAHALGALSPQPLVPVLPPLLELALLPLPLEPELALEVEPPAVELALLLELELLLELDELWLPLLLEAPWPPPVDVLWPPELPELEDEALLELLLALDDEALEWLLEVEVALAEDEALEPVEVDPPGTSARKKQPGRASRATRWRPERRIMVRIAARASYGGNANIMHTYECALLTLAVKLPAATVVRSPDGLPS
jgi:hypothetical protein